MIARAAREHQSAAAIIIGFGGLRYNVHASSEDFVQPLFNLPLDPVSTQTPHSNMQGRFIDASSCRAHQLRAYLREWGHLHQKRSVAGKPPWPLQNAGAPAQAMLTA